MRYLKSAVRRLTRLMDIEISRFSTSPVALLVRAIRSRHLDLVLDIGANNGQFAIELREAGYKGRIVSFEPVSSAFKVLQSRARRDNRWTAERLALGNHSGEAVINVSGNAAASSSILPMLETCRQAAPEACYVSTEIVPTITLDDYGLCEPAFVKIDVQGYESHVLDGASRVLPYVVGLHIEMSLVPLYEGQELFDSMEKRLRDSGFKLWAASPAMFERSSGQVLQVDAVLFR